MGIRIRRWGQPPAQACREPEGMHILPREISGRCGDVWRLGRLAYLRIAPDFAISGSLDQLGSAQWFNAFSRNSFWTERFQRSGSVPLWDLIRNSTILQSLQIRSLINRSINEICVAMSGSHISADSGGQCG